jgi:polysaccharide pyruvyl transferase WcaK-like protein
MIASAAASRSPRVLLLGGAGGGNLGDEALLLAAVRSLRQVDADVVVATPQKMITGWTLRDEAAGIVAAPRACLLHQDRHYARADPVFVERWKACRDIFSAGSAEGILSRLAGKKLPWFIDRRQAMRLVYALCLADAVVVHGGGILTSSTRSRLWDTSLIAGLCRQLSKPLLLRSQQIGPIMGTEDLERLREIIRAACFIGVRDRNLSAQLCRSTVDGTEVHECVDDALFVDLKLGDVRQIVERLNLKPQNYIAVSYRGHESLRVAQDFMETFATICRVAGEGLRMPLVFIPQCLRDEADLKRIRRLTGGRGRVLPWRGLSWDAVAVAQCAALSIAVPHHSIIFALRGATPFISPVAGPYYTFKNIGSLDHFGLKDNVISWDADPATFAQRSLARLQFVTGHIGDMRKGIAETLGGLKKLAGDFDAAFITALREAISGHHR